MKGRLIYSHPGGVTSKDVFLFCSHITVVFFIDPHLPGQGRGIEKTGSKAGARHAFFGGNAPENICGIFGSREAIEKFKESVCNEMLVSLQKHTDATNEDMRKRGVPTINDLHHKILAMQTELMKNTTHPPVKAQQKQGFQLAVRSGKALHAIRRLWSKVPDDWNKNPYA